MNEHIFTKRHYEAIAKAIRGARAHNRFVDPWEKAAYNRATEVCETMIANMFIIDSESFNFMEFSKAIRGKESEE